MMELTRHDAPGLRANWLNAWLAAIGVTVLLDDVKLSWTENVVPQAVFWSDRASLVEDIAAELPDEEALDRSAVASESEWSEHSFGRTVTLEQYRDRAAYARWSGDHLLAASVTDLRADVSRDLPHGPFDPSAPRGETLYTRAKKCRSAIGNATESVEATLAGTAVRQQMNGLGFDPLRLSTGVQAGGPASKVHVDPVVELLALAALRLFPVRGDGVRVRQRGWTDRATIRGAFEWHAWSQPLDVWAIDALLDTQIAGSAHRWRSVPYTSSTPSDPTRAYFSEFIS